ncbi:MAG: hypothetical protein M8861_08775 [marine benthic group bacterium]|nr:hypothetical protein [Gemmatimonadota bacterium]
MIVLGPGLTALGVQRSLARVGVTTFLVDDTNSMARRSRWARNRVIEYPESRDPEPLHALLERLPFDKAVLIATSDKWAAAVAGLPDSIRTRFVTSMPPQAAVELLGDKALFAGALQRLDVPHPWTRVITTAQDLDTIPDERWPHLFLKPADSQSFSQLFGVKAFSIADRADAAERLRQMHEAGIGAVAQEYIPGPPDLHYFIDGFVDRFGRVRGLLSRRRTRMYPFDYGNSTFVKTVPLDTVSGAVESLKTLFGDIEYRGIFSAEFKHDPRDGRFRLLEVNVRPWWYNEFTALCGVNVSELSYLDALELPVPERLSFTIGARHVLMPSDLFAYLALRRTSEVTFRSWSRDVWGASDAVFRWNDPWPAIESVRHYPRRAAREMKRIYARSRSNR